MRRRCLASIVMLAVLLSVSCTRDRESIFAATPTVPTPPPPPLFVTSVGVFPTGVIGGGSALGTANLDLPAPAGGLLVNLASSRPQAIVPPTITVPPGRTTVDFPITTSAVGGDLEVTISVTGGGQTRTTMLAVWAVLDNFVVYVREPSYTNIPRISERYTLANARLAAVCTGNALLLGVNPPTGTALSWYFTAPRGRPLRPGTYVVNGSIDGPEMNVQGGCGPMNGRFVVQEAVFAANGVVRRFVATFEDRCGENTTTPLTATGQIQLTNAPPLSFSNPPCQQ